MKHLSAVLIVVAGVGLILGSALFAHDQTALFVRGCGVSLMLVGAVGWLAILWVSLASHGLPSGDES